MAGTVATTTNSTAIVNGTAGDDVFVIAPTGVILNGTTILSGAWTTLTVNGRSGVDSVTIDDQATSAGSYYLITDTMVGRAVEAVPQTSFTNTLSYINVENLAVNAGDIRDFIDVQSTAAGATLVDGGRSGDVFKSATTACCRHQRPLISECDVFQWYRFVLGRLNASSPRPR